MLQFVLLFNWMLVVYLWIDQIFLPICSSFRATLNRRPVPQRRRRPSKHWSNQDRKVGKSTTTKTIQPQNIYPGKIWRVSTSKFIPMQSDTQQCQNWHFVKWKPNLADLSGRHMKCIRFTSFCSSERSWTAWSGTGNSCRVWWEDLFRLFILRPFLFEFWARIKKFMLNFVQGVF